MDNQLEQIQTKVNSSNSHEELDLIVDEISLAEDRNFYRLAMQIIQTRRYAINKSMVKEVDEVKTIKEQLEGGVEQSVQVTSSDNLVINNEPMSPQSFMKQFRGKQEDVVDERRVDNYKPKGFLVETNHTPLHNSLFDFFFPGMDEDELKVTLYIARHTLGYEGKKDGDFISQHQILNGIVTKTGKRIDWGAGLKSRDSERADKQNLSRVINRLEQAGIIIVMRNVKRKPSDKHSTNFYRLNLHKIKNHDILLPSETPATDDYDDNLGA